VALGTRSDGFQKEQQLIALLLGEIHKFVSRGLGFTAVPHDGFEQIAGTPVV
jgi:hypothetical protein